MKEYLLQPLPVTTSTVQDWKKKSFVNTQAIKAQWESALQVCLQNFTIGFFIFKIPYQSDCLQRELPDSRSEFLDHSQERKWVQPAKKGCNL